MPAGFQEWLRTALADSLPSALAALRDTQHAHRSEAGEEISDSEDSLHPTDEEPARKRPWSDVTATDKGKTPLKKSRDGPLPLLASIPRLSVTPPNTSQDNFQILDEYYAGDSKPGTSRSRSPIHLCTQLHKEPETNPDLPVEILDSSGVPLFDPHTLRHPRSAEWSPPQHIAEFLRYWLRRPLEKEVRQKLRAECTRPTLPDKVASTPEFDSLFVTFMMRNGKDPRKGLEQGLRSTQDKLLDISGPLTQIFLMADEALTDGTPMDPQLTREWAQRALCLLGNANTALSTERRKAALFKLDSKLAELAPKELGPGAKGLLFGDKFLKNLSQHVNIFTSLNKAQSSMRRVFQSRDRFSHRAGRQRGRATSRAAFMGSRPRLQESSSSYRFQNRTNFRTPYYRGHTRTRVSSSYRTKFPSVHRELLALRDKGAIERVVGAPCFISNIFLVRKKSGEFRPVINLRSLNQHVAYRHFKMEGIHLLRDLLRDRDWFFPFGSKGCLPHGAGPSGPQTLSSIPVAGKSTKLLKPVMEFLRARGIRSIVYLDDILIMARDRPSLYKATSLTVQLLQDLGFLINKDKSELYPTQSIQFLGFTVDSVEAILKLPQSKMLSIRKAIRRFLRLPRVSLRDLARIIGLLSSSIQAIFPGPLHYRAMQRLKDQHLRATGSYDHCFPLTDEVRLELQWWLTHMTAWNGSAIFGCIPDFILESDASLLGWGATCGTLTTGGLWTPEERGLHINCLELIAGSFAVRSSQRMLPTAL
ncbi:uncharacterized protein RCH25_044212 [Pelodytes ibericus]